MSIEVKLDFFKGPLDLLLHLIDKNKVNIYDIPIVSITEQYIEYLYEMDKLNMDVASEFLLMAATLIEIKAKMLLPKEESLEEEEDPREQLVKQLLEYKKYKDAAKQLNNLQQKSYATYFRAPEKSKESYAVNQVPIDELLKKVDLESLYVLFLRLIKQQKNKVDPIRSKFNEIEREHYTVEEKIDFLMKQLESLKELSFKKSILQCKNKSESITIFLAVLELMKMNKVVILQEDNFKDIRIRRSI